MEDCGDDRNRKRGREDNSFDSDVDSPELKNARVESGSCVGGLPETEVNRVDSEVDDNSSGSQLTRFDSSGSSINSNDSDQLPGESLNSPEAKRIQDDLLNILDETDGVPDRDLDSVMRSFQEEIMIPKSGSVWPEVETGLGGPQQELGYLLEASDDELGLPPTATSGVEKSTEEGIESVKEVPEALKFNGFMGFEDDIPSYDSLGFGVGAESGNSNVVEYVTFDGLFEYSEPGDGLWRYESLQAQ